MVSRVAEEFHKTNGTDVVVQVGTVGQIQKRLEAGERADVVIVSAAALKSLDEAGELLAHAPLGRSGMGIGVRAGTPHPDLSSTAAFRQVLLHAHRIATTDPASGATSGTYFAQLVHKLAMDDAVIPKEILVRGGPACTIIVQGKADICAQNITEILQVPGVDLAGPFPAAIQNYITYSAGVLKHAASPDTATAFIHALRAPERAAQWREAGFEP